MNVGILHKLCSIISLYLMLLYCPHMVPSYNEVHEWDVTFGCRQYIEQEADRAGIGKGLRCLLLPVSLFIFACDLHVHAEEILSILQL